MSSSVLNAVTLPRPVLQWLMGLDLSFSVKNARRDFGNGYLVAEIFSRYFDRDVTMHSFQNGTGMKGKRDNWAQLLKFFDKRGIAPGGIPITKQEVEAVMAADPATVLHFVSRIYEFLTGQRLASSAAPPPTSYIVPNAALRAAMGFAGEEKRAEEIEEEAAELEVPTEEEAPSGGAPGSPAAVTVRAVRVTAIEDDAQAARARAAKEMSLGGYKGVSGSVGCGPRASPSPGSSPMMGLAGASSELDPPALMGEGSRGSPVRMPRLKAVAENATTAAAGVAAALGPGKVLELLNTAVLTALGDAAVDRFLNPALPAALAFVDAALGTGLSPAAIASAFTAVSASAGPIAAACLASPRGFYHVTAMLIPILTAAAVDSAAFLGAAASLVAIGEAMTEPAGTPSARSSASSLSTQPVENEALAVAASLFNDFALVQVAEIARKRPGKRAAAVRILFAYGGGGGGDAGFPRGRPAAAHARLACLRTLQSTLDEPGVFIHCASLASSMDVDVLDEGLADLYAYLALVGMSSASPAVRASGVALVASLATAAPGLAAGLLPRVNELAKDSWWQVRAAALQTACALLASLAELAGSEEGSSAAASSASSASLDLIAAVASPDAAPAISRMYVSLTAPLLREHASELGVAWVRHVAAMPAAAREAQLGVTARGTFVAPQVDVLPLSGPSAQRYELQPCGPSLPYAAVLSSLAMDVTTRGLQTLEVGHFQALLAAVAAVGGEGESPEGATFQLPPEFAVLSSTLREYLFVGLCDPLCCPAAAALLRHVISRSPSPEGLALLASPTLQVSLQILHQPSSGAQQPEHVALVARMLLSVAKAGAPAGATRAVRELLSGWAQRYPSLYADSPLRGVLESLA